MTVILRSSQFETEELLISMCSACHQGPLSAIDVSNGQGLAEMLGQESHERCLLLIGAPGQEVLSPREWPAPGFDKDGERWSLSTTEGVGLGSEDKGAIALESLSQRVSPTSHGSRERAKV